MTVVIVAAVALAGMVIFGALWLRTLRELHAVKAECDRYWDLCNEAAPLVALAKPPDEDDQSVM
jgi:hypothetical protein